MQKLKDVLVGSLGIVGYGIWTVLLYGFYFIPVFVLNIPWWVSIIIVLCVVNIPIFGEVLYFATWIWSFIIIVSESINLFSIFYFVVFGLYVFTGVIPSVVRLITAIFDKKNEEIEESCFRDIVIPKDEVENWISELETLTNEEQEKRR